MMGVFRFLTHEDKWERWYAQIDENIARLEARTFWCEDFPADALEVE